MTKVERLGDFVRVRTGKLDANASSGDGEYPFFTCSEQPLRIASFSYDCECVLVAGNGDLNIKYYKGKFDAYQRTYIIESADAEILDVRYLFHFMSIYVKQLRAMSIGGVIKYIKLGYLTDAKIPIPPLPEQRRIAEVLDKAEALRTKRRAALAELDSLTQSLFLDLFGDPAINPKGWRMSSLSEISAIHTGKTPPTQLAGMFGGETPFATPGDLDEGLLSTERTLTADGVKYSKVVRAGSALVCCIGNIGKMAKTPVSTAFNQQINAVEWGIEIHDDFGIAALAFQKQQMLNKASSTIVPILNKSGFSKVTIPVPPLDLQREFARRVAVVEKLKAAQRASLADLNTLFFSLQHRAFSRQLFA
jgi:type I restriction enzyme S subunit